MRQALSTLQRSFPSLPFAVHGGAWTGRDGGTLLSASSATLPEGRKGGGEESGIERRGERKWRGKEGKEKREGEGGRKGREKGRKEGEDR